MLVAGILVAIMLLATACGHSPPTARPSPQTVEPRPQPAIAAQQPVKFERISLEHGLSQSSVYNILQDSRGFMWFGTEDGLNKYDGYNFTVYKPVPGDLTSLSQNFTTAIYEDASGMLWLGTEGGGLEKFDRDKEHFTHYWYDPNNSRSLGSDYVWTIYPDHTGALWIGTLGSGLDRFDPTTEEFTHYRANLSDSRSLSSNTIQAIYQDRQGTLWVGTDTGLNRLDPSGKQFVRYYNDPTDPNSLSHNSIRSIYKDRQGQLWIGTEGGGLDQLDRSSGRFTHYRHSPNNPGSLSHNSVWAIYQDRYGALWVGTDDGLNCLDRDTLEFTHYHNDPTDPNSLSDNSVRSIYEDRSGVLWIGTYGGGISKLDRSKTRFMSFPAIAGIPNGLATIAVRAIYQDQEGLLWVGTAGSGLYKIDRDNAGYALYQASPNTFYGPSHNVIRSIAQDQAGTLWIGTEGGGLNSLERATGRFTRYQNDPANPNSLSDDTVMAVYQDRQGDLWIGTQQGGLDRFDRASGRFIHYQYNPYNPRTLSSNYVRVIYQDREGVLWLGTGGGGLNKLERREDSGGEIARFTRYLAAPDQPNSLSDNIVLSICQDQRGALWIGTAGGGLNRFDREKESFTHYREANGLPNDVVYGILEDNQGYLWLSTNKGLSRFNPQTETFTNYDAGDGLQSNEFNGGAFYKSASGELFFGGINGLNAFYPETIQDNPYLPPIALTALTQGGQKLELGQAVESAQAVTFQWPNNYFEFEFAAQSFNQPEKNQYAYKLDGLDKDWNYTGNQRFGRYTNLPARTYTLRIKGSNNDGVWNKEGVSVTISIVPPFWETLWFRATVILAVLGGALGAYRLRVNSIQRKSRELETLVEQRTAELRQEIRQRLQAEEALRASETEKAIASERSRLARDLHDVVTQTLFSAKLVAEAIPAAWERDRKEGQQLLAELQQLTQGAQAEMRTLLLELRPAALIETSLADLLRQLAEAIIGREGMAVTVTANGQCALPADVHIALYRIAQEALNNVAKHARANQATVDLHSSVLQQDKRTVTVKLCVRDNGRGFNPGNTPPNHLGLGIMRERAQAIGATLDIKSQPGLGTQITVEWTGAEKGKPDEHSKPDSGGDC